MREAWFNEARAMLANGYGVEDIAVHCDVPVQNVRDLVSSLRASGQLLTIIRGAA